MASFWATIILGIVSVQSTSGQTCTFDANCFRFKIGCGLVNAFPFWRLTPSTCEQCLQLCQSKQGGSGSPFCCQSAVYDAVAQSCDLFATSYGFSSLKSYPGRSYFQPTGAPGCGAAGPAAALCKDGETAKLISVKDYSADGVNGQDVPNVDANGCGKACLSGKTPDGNAIACQSALFNNGKCTLSQDKPKDTGDLTKSPGANYFFVKCFPSDLVKGCPDTFLEAPEKILVGQNRLTVDKATTDECIKSCLTAEKDQGFQCKSGIFYYKESKLNCILNVESAGSKPDLYTDAPPEDIELYFELGCGGGKKYSMAKKKKSKAFKAALKDVPDNVWANWSPCDAKHTTKIRFKQCTAYDSRKCDKEEVPCKGAPSHNSAEKLRHDGKMTEDKKKKAAQH